MHTGRPPCEDKDRDHGDASPRRGPAGMAGQLPEAGCVIKQILPHSSQKEPTRADALISDYSIRNCETPNFCSHSVCLHARKLMQYLPS